MTDVVVRLVPERRRRDVPGGGLASAEIRLPGVPRGAVIVLCEAGGLNHGADEVMNRLAEHGYESVAVDLAGLEDAAALRAVRALVAHLRDWGWQPEQLGLLGYRDGGRSALLAAGELELGAAISVCATGLSSEATDGLIRAARRVRTSWLGIFGADDPHAPAGLLDHVRELAASSEQYAEVVVYPGVDGTFYRGLADPLAYAASFDSWQRTAEWLNVRVVPRTPPLMDLWPSPGTSVRRRPVGRPSLS